MKSLMHFWRVLADELARSCNCSTAIERDYATLDRRFGHEGLSLLTITLPAFAKDFERSLERGMVDPSDSFRSWKYQKGLPAFLGGFLDQVFDRRSGALLDEPVLFAIFAIRQLTLTFKKMQLDCSKERTDAAIAQYVQTDSEVGEIEDLFVGSPLQAEFRRVNQILFADTFTKLNEDVYYTRLVPKHGPGRTADRLTGNGKFNQVEWTDRLEAIFSYGEYCLANPRYYYRYFDATFRSPGDERPVRVVTVPKTQETPRIIAIEPTAMQYSQQAMMTVLVDFIENDEFLGAVIGFRDQLPNQELAREGSRNGLLATLDLSEASDRVSFQHVMTALHRFPFAREGVDACRSRRASVPAHYYHPEQVMEIRKFASMGSALTFPFEAIVFTTVIAMAIDAARQEEHERPAKTRKDFQRVLAGVRVYGDDIIVPVRYVASVIQYLEAFGLKVNTGKSFWKGKFRESCGKEYYNGHDVSVTKVRQVFPSSRQRASEVISLVSLRNQLWYAGLFDTCEYLDGLIARVLPRFPVVLPGSPVLGKLSFESPTIDEYDEDLHLPMVKGYVPSSIPPDSFLDGDSALLKHFLKMDGKPFMDEKHLERAGRPDSVKLKNRTVSIHETSSQKSTSLKKSASSWETVNVETTNLHA